MSIKYLGETFDIHGGGMDLLFPHHENELAQSESATGKTFARYWMHNGLTKMRTKLASGEWTDEKMSGSIGNVISVKELITKHGAPLVRYMLLMTHYRRPIDFSDEVVTAAELMGGRVHDRLPVAWTLASGDTATDIAEAEEMLARRRHNIFKLKIGRGDPRHSIAHVAAIKTALGDRASIRVDVNQAWSEAIASRCLPLLSDAGVDLIEQPIALRNIKGLARLARETSVAIMADEALSGPETAFQLAQSAAADVFALKIAQSGGLFAAAKVAAIAEAAGIGLYGGTMLEGAVGTVASAQLFSTLSKLEWGTELFGPLLLTEEILEEPLDYSEFSLKVPTGDGLGISIDEDRLNCFRRDRAERSFHVLPNLKTGS